jgi:hypothetical protein
MEKQVTFIEMSKGTADDYAIITEHSAKFSKKLADRILDHLALLKGDTGGFPIDRYAHSCRPQRALIVMGAMRSMWFVPFYMT